MYRKAYEKKKIIYIVTSAYIPPQTEDVRIQVGSVVLTL
jgi:hypothetical protein